MIDFYTWTTPNGRKISVMLEECGLEYTTHAVNLQKEEQFKPEFLAIAPNNKIPAIVDHDVPGGPVSIFESGAILLHLADKSGKFLPADGPERAKVLEWLFWQMGGIGPIMGQAGHFTTQAPEQVPYAIDRFISESARLIKVLDTQLGKTEFMAGDYSIADMATYPWVILGFDLIKSAKPDVIGEGENVARWIKTIGERPAVIKGMAVPEVAS
ncbi:MAG: glutathione S-transferase N-terminal domain-containing protein [Rhodobiaceae bacterium]|nr:disulfide-bond oxidoreductase YfcG [Rhodobiaceae bacterium]MCR9241128.1 glutathione S-transferase N-terminal domain-containing protein [Rhodobiaceae bacterium]